MLKGWKWERGLRWPSTLISWAVLYCLVRAAGVLTFSFRSYHIPKWTVAFASINRTLVTEHFLLSPAGDHLLLLKHCLVPSWFSCLGQLVCLPISVYPTMYRYPLKNKPCLHIGFFSRLMSDDDLVSPWAMWRHPNSDLDSVRLTDSSQLMSIPMQRSYQNTSHQITSRNSVHCSHMPLILWRVFDECSWINQEAEIVSNFRQ